MSLNGLDRPDVQDAHDAAVAEAGGWFFLKYTARDSVDLLGRGKGGVHEARVVVAKYPEASPLYGVVVYRRRKVLIKLVPENTSRLLLARTAVHFLDVIHKYTPYEALLEISSSDSLTDTHLAASFPLHTATPSASSTRLDEITEDGEDPGPSEPSLITSSPNGSSLASQRYRSPVPRLHTDRSPTDSPVSAASPRATSPTMSHGKPSMSQFLLRNTAGKPSITSLASESVASTAGYSVSETSAKETEPSLSTLEPSSTNLPAPESSRSDPSMIPQEPKVSGEQRRDITEMRPATSAARQSTASSVQTATRPSTSTQASYEDDLFDFLKPKPKLGPRPVLASEKTRRPTVASVSAMPAPYRYSMRKVESLRPASQGLGAPPSPAPTRALPTPPPIPDAPEYTPRPLSRGSVKSLPSHKSTAMTPDKLRLLKAVELRKRQMRKSNPHAGEFVPPPDEPLPAVPAVLDLAPTQEKAVSKEEIVEPVVPVPPAESTPMEDGVKAPKADSGIELDYNKGEHQDPKRSWEDAVIEEQRSEVAKIEPGDEPSAEESRSAEGAVDNTALPLPGQPPAELTKDETVEVQPLSLESKQPALPEQPSPELTIPSAFVTPVNDLDGSALDSAVQSEEGKKDLTDSEVQPLVAGEQSERPPTAPQEEVREVPEIVAENDPQPAPPTPQAEETTREDDKSSNDDLDMCEMSPKRKNSDLARRRQGFVQPIHIDSDAESFTDDGLMEELQSATVQEATPVMVSAASPIQEYFSGQRAGGASSPFGAPTTPAEGRDARILTPTPAEAPEEAEDEGAMPQMEPPSIPPRAARPPMAIGDLPIGLKRNVSSEISKRIQALATTTNRESTSRDNSPIFASSSRPMSPESNDAARPSRSPIHSRSNSYRALLRGSTKVPQQPPVRITPKAPQPVWTVQRDPVTNRESVSVTARIVRPITSDTTETPTTAEDDTAQALPSTGKDGLSSHPPTPQQNDTNPNSPVSKRASNPVSPTISRTSKDVARAPSQASHYQQQQKAIPSPTVDDFPPPPQGPDHRRNQRSSISVPNDENASVAAPKEGSRTSRFFKRMSTIGSKRRSGMHQPPEGSGSAAAIAGANGNANVRPMSKEIEVHTLMPAPVVVGHLNIQFPDSLLWKRRIVAIDESGYIKFTIPSQTTTATAAQQASKMLTARRFLLSDFAAPFVPDVDRQELPNSIMLDFLEAGTTLQIACEDPVTLVRVSHVLRTYWRAWARASRVSTLGP